jgi:hypothetical protein
MSNALDTYLEQSRRVASLMGWLGAALERHDERAPNFDDSKTLWHMVGRLARVEAELKPILGFIAGMTEGEIEQALNDGGQGDE